MSRWVIDKFNNEIQTTTPVLNFPIQGHYVIRTNDGVAIDEPADVNDLILQKFAGLLAIFPEFDEIVYDELQNDVDIDKTAPDRFARTGLYEQVLPPNGGRITTNVLDLTVLTGLGSPPVKFQPFFHFYEIIKTPTNRVSYTESYSEVSPSLVTTEISFDGGSTFAPMSNEIVDLIGVPDTDMVLRFTNSTSSEIRLGSWAVLLTDTL